MCRSKNYMYAQHPRVTADTVFVGMYVGACVYVWTCMFVSSPFSSPVLRQNVTGCQMCRSQNCCDQHKWWMWKLLGAFTWQLAVVKCVRGGEHGSCRVLSLDHSLSPCRSFITQVGIAEFPECTDTCWVVRKYCTRVAVECNTFVGPHPRWKASIYYS